MSGTAYASLCQRTSSKRTPTRNTPFCLFCDCVQTLDYAHVLCRTPPTLNTVIVIIMVMPAAEKSSRSAREPVSASMTSCPQSKRRGSSEGTRRRGPLCIRGRTYRRRPAGRVASRYCGALEIKQPVIGQIPLHAWHPDPICSFLSSSKVTVCSPWA